MGGVTYAVEANLIAMHREQLIKVSLLIHHIISCLFFVIEVIFPLVLQRTLHSKDSLMQFR